MKNKKQRYIKKILYASFNSYTDIVTTPFLQQK